MLTSVCRQLQYLTIRKTQCLKSQKLVTIFFLESYELYEKKIRKKWLI